VDDDGLLHDLMLLPQGACSIAKRGDGSARRSNFPKGALAFRRARAAEAEETVLYGQRGGTGMLGIAGQAKRLGLAVDHGRANGLSPGQ